MVKIAASMMLADFRRLEEELHRIAGCGADLIHWDVMDGNFVPNLTFGAHIINAAREVIDLPFDVHLMVNDPELLISQLSLAKTDFVCPHIEPLDDLRPDLLTIRERGWRPAVALSPDTPLERILEPDLLPLLDMVSVMGVRPGFAGQRFIGTVLQKISALRRRLNKERRNVLISVDGGVSFNNASEIAVRGTDILVSGNTIFRSELNLAEAIQKLRLVAAGKTERA